MSSKAHSAGSVELDDLHFTKGRKYDPWVSYGQSKMANILYAKGLQVRSNGQYIATSLHPGVIHTNLGRHMPMLQMAMFRFLSLVPGAIERVVGEALKSIE